MVKISKLNLVEYGKLMNVFPQAIFYRLKAGVPLPGVIDTERFRNLWILHFDTSTNLDEARKAFKITSGRGGNKKKKKNVV